MFHSHESASLESAVTTTGHVIRWANWYDPLVRLFTLGQATRLRRNTVALAAIQTGNAVLDVGCGTGDLTLAAWRAAGSSGQVAGIDPAAEMIDVAQHKAAAQKSRADFRVGVIEALPFADESFDVVLSSLMMHHLPGDLKAQGLAEIHRVLRPGGRLVIVDFTGPISRLSKAVMTVLLHGGHQAGIQELVPRLKAAHFIDIDAGRTTLPFLSYIRAQKDGAA